MPNIPTIPNFPPQGIQAQLDLLYLYNPDAANKLIEQLEAGLIKVEELQKEIEKALQDMQGVLRYKGSVQTEADLPTTGNVIGDVWNIISTDENVAWTGTEWDKFGSAIDTSIFFTKEEAKGLYTEVETNKNDIADLSGQVANIESKIPGNASAENQLVTKADITGLPDQAGHTGFLKTDGTNATWSDKEALVNNATQTRDIAIGTSAVADGQQEGATALGMQAQAASKAVAIGWSAKTGPRSTAVGNNAKSMGRYSVAVGMSAEIAVNTDNAVQLGVGKLGDAVVNDESNTFKFGNANGNFKIVDADGTIPAERLAAGGTTGQVLSKTETGMQWVDMGGGSGLPDQTGHTGFLQTNGTDASWSNVTAVTTRGTGSGIVIGGYRSKARFPGTVAIGDVAVVEGSWGVAIGGAATANGNWSVAIGSSATVTANSAIQLGNGTNNVQGTLRVGLGGDAKNYLLLQTDGTIPSGRLAAAPTEEGTYTLKATVAADGTVTMAWVKDA